MCHHCRPSTFIVSSFKLVVKDETPKGVSKNIYFQIQPKLNLFLNY